LLEPSNNGSGSWNIGTAFASDLHDHVIQRLFAVGLSLQSLASTANDQLLEQRLTRAVDGLDETTRQIRTTISAPAAAPPDDV
jgi:hypothetical protein